MPEDIVEHIQGSLVQHGPHNDRVYLMHLNTGNPRNLIPVLDDMARRNGYGKIFAKIQAPLWHIFESAGYEKEAVVPGFFRGKVDAFFVAKYFSYERKTFLEDKDALEPIPENTQSVPTSTSRVQGAYHNIDACQPSDTAEMSTVYRRAFASYPFPIQNPAFLDRMMDAGNLYFCIRVKGRIVALAAAEVDLPHQVVEMTDFATLPQWRGRGFAGSLLRLMHRRVRDLGIQTAFTIARASSPGMNSVFKNRGYHYAGLLKNNSQICGSIQSMTVWYRYL